MNRRFKIFGWPLTSLLTLSGCQTTHQDIQLGPDRFQTTVIAPVGRGTISSAQRMALDAADARCGSLGKQLNVAAIDTSRSFLEQGHATVTYECLKVQ